MAKKTLQISPDVKIPVNIATATSLVLGGKGMGKTNLLAVVLEEVSRAGVHWSAIDPMGVLWGLRYGVDGKSKGTECLILGGVHGDMPIEPTGGVLVADLVVDYRENVIIDISRKANGQMWSIAERVRFMLDYGTQLYKRQGSTDAKGNRRPPLFQAIDEIARFIPQIIRSNQGQLAECAGMWAAICEEGRNVGLGMFMVTQRNARISKDVAELADVMMAFRTVGPNSVGAVTDWLGDHVAKEKMHTMVEEVRKLPIGSCLAVSPGWLEFEGVIKIRARQTFDSSATPKVGEQKRKVQGSGAKPDLAKFQQLMQATIERAKNESVPDLQRRIRELEAKARKPESQKAGPAAPAKTVEVKVPTPDPATVKANASLRKHFRVTLEEADRIVKQLEHNYTVFRDKVLKNLEAIESSEPTPAERAGQSRVADALNSRPAPLKFPDKRVVLPSKPAKFDDSTLKRVVTNGNGEEMNLGTASTKIAVVAAGYGEQGVEKKLLAAICGYPPNGSFYNRISDAKMAGAVTVDGTRVYTTPAGTAQYGGQFTVPTTTEEVMALWMPKLGGAAQKILQYLVDQGGEYVTRQQLAEATGYPLNGSFYNRISDVRVTGLLVEQGKNVAVSKELMFL